MSIEAIRQSLVAAVESAKAGFSEYALKIGYDNRDIIDPLKQTSPFLEVEVQLGPGWQADLSPDPIHRISGLLILTAKVREGNGTAQINRLLDHFYPKLQRRRIGLALTEMPSFPKGKSVNGLYAQSVLIPFVADKTYGVQS